MSNYIKKLNKGIEKQSELLQRLQVRLDNYKHDLHHEDLTPSQANDISIAILKTESEMDTLSALLNEKRNYFEKYSVYFEKELAKANAEWDGLVRKAKVQAVKNTSLQPIMKALAEVEDIEADPDKKLFIYKRLKALVNG